MYSAEIATQIGKSEYVIVVRIAPPKQLAARACFIPFGIGVRGEQVAAIEAVKPRMSAKVKLEWRTRALQH